MDFHKNKKIRIIFTLLCIVFWGWYSLENGEKLTIMSTFAFLQNLVIVIGAVLGAVKNVDWLLWWVFHKNKGFEDEIIFNYAQERCFGLTDNKTLFSWMIENKKIILNSEVQKAIIKIVDETKNYTIIDDLAKYGTKFSIESLRYTIEIGNLEILNYIPEEQLRQTDIEKNTLFHFFCKNIVRYFVLDIHHSTSQWRYDSLKGLCDFHKVPYDFDLDIKKNTEKFIYLLNKVAIDTNTKIKGIFQIYDTDCFVTANILDNITKFIQLLIVKAAVDINAENIYGTTCLIYLFFAIYSRDSVIKTFQEEFKNFLGYPQSSVFAKFFDNGADIEKAKFRIKDPLMQIMPIRGYEGLSLTCMAIRERFLANIIIKKYKNTPLAIDEWNFSFVEINKLIDALHTKYILVLPIREEYEGCDVSYNMNEKYRPYFDKYGEDSQYFLENFPNEQDRVKKKQEIKKECSRIFNIKDSENFSKNFPNEQDRVKKRQEIRDAFFKMLNSFKCEFDGALKAISEYLSIVEMLIDYNNKNAPPSERGKLPFQDTDYVKTKIKFGCLESVIEKLEEYDRNTREKTGEQEQLTEICELNKHYTQFKEQNAYILKILEEYIDNTYSHFCYNN